MAPSGVGRTATRGVLRTALKARLRGFDRTSSAIGVASGMVYPTSSTILGTAAPAATSTASASKRLPAVVDTPVTRPPLTLNRCPTGLCDDFTTAGGELIEQHADQGREIHPALARVENGALTRDRTWIDARRYGRNLVRRQKLRVIADALFVGEDLGDFVRRVVRIPCQAAVKTKPWGSRIPGRQGAVAIDADHAQPVILGRAEACRVQPGERPAGRFVAQSAFGHEGHLSAQACKLHGRGHSENSAADDGHTQG